MFRLISPAFRAEVFANLRLALPLIAAQLAAVGMGTIDNVYAGRLGPQALAAVGVAVQTYNLFLIFFMGLLMACSPITAQMFGARRPAAEIGAFLRRSRRFAFGTGLLWTLSINLVGPPVLRLLGLPAATTAAAIGFLHWLSMAGLMTSLWFALRFGAEGLGQVWPIVLAGTAGLAANAGFGWLFVFGHCGLPKLGINGLGLATSLATALMAGTLALQYRLLPALRPYRLPKALPAMAGVEGAREILRLGLPIALIVTAEGGRRHPSRRPELGFECRSHAAVHRPDRRPDHRRSRRRRTGRRLPLARGRVPAVRRPAGRRERRDRGREM
ncbi:MAG: hypothetical protein NVS9B10_29620 [Nevskia sp.]